MTFGKGSMNYSMAVLTASKKIGKRRSPTIGCSQEKVGTTVALAKYDCGFKVTPAYRPKMPPAN